MGPNLAEIRGKPFGSERPARSGQGAPVLRLLTARHRACGIA